MRLIFIDNLYVTLLMHCCTGMYLCCKLYYIFRYLYGSLQHSIVWIDEDQPFTC